MSPSEPMIDDDHDHPVRLGGRSFRRCAALAAAIALSAVFSATGADAAVPPPTARTITGVGEVTPPGCDEGAYKVPFTATTTGGETWVTIRPIAVAVACPALVYGTTTTFAGSWDPRSGGCIPASSGNGGRICIGAMPHRGVTNGIAFRLCPDPVRCFSGDAWIGRM